MAERQPLTGGTRNVGIGLSPTDAKLVSVSVNAPDAHAYGAIGGARNALDGTPCGRCFVSFLTVLGAVTLLVGVGTAAVWTADQARGAGGGALDDDDNKVNGVDLVAQSVPYLTHKKHQLQPSPLWGAVKRPYPTGAWWTNMVIDDGNGAIAPLPCVAPSRPRPRALSRARARAPLRA